MFSRIRQAGRYFFRTSQQSSNLVVEATTACHDPHCTAQAAAQQIYEPLFTVKLATCEQIRL